MKNKTKLILGLASMLGVTAAAGTTAGFAWFTTIRTATVSLTNAHVYTDYGNLAIQYVALDSGLSAPISPTTTNQTNVLGLAAATTGITDISGDGKTFYKPTWDPTDTNGTVANYITQITNGYDLNKVDFKGTPDTSKTWYVQFGLNLINSGTNAFSVYLESASAVTGVNVNAGSDPILQAQQAKNDAAAKATRVAVWSTDPVADPKLPLANMTTWQDDTTDSSYQYLTTAATGISAYTVDGYNLATPAAGTFHAGSFSQISLASDAVAGQVIATVPGKVGTTDGSVEVIVSAWIEGTLSTAKNAAIGGNVDLALALAAI